jgi:hypothetical protein
MSIIYCCDELKDIIQNDETHFYYNKKYREFVINYKEGFGGGVQLVNYCPWCGTKLIDELSDRWFQELEKLGFDEPFDQEIPEEFKTDEWWIRRKL